jgi:hypothetical protein
MGESTAPLLTLVCRASSLPTGGTICLENLREGFKDATGDFAKVTVLSNPKPIPTATFSPEPTITFAALPTTTETTAPTFTLAQTPIPTGTETPA